MKKKKNTEDSGDLAFVLGICIGLCIGLLLSIAFNDILYFPLYLVVGLTFGVVISGEKIELKWSTKDKKSKPIIRFDANAKLEKRTTPKKILIESIGTAAVVVIIIFLCSTCFREAFKYLIDIFDKMNTREILESVLLLLPFLYIIIILLKFLPYVFNDNKNK